MVQDERPVKLLLQAIEIGEHLIAIADTIGEDVAANHIAAGLEILLARAEAALALDQGRLDKPQALN